MTIQVFRLVGVEEMEPQALSWLLDRAAGYLQRRGDYALARPLLERALAITEKVLGPDHPDTVASRRALESLPPSE